MEYGDVRAKPAHRENYGWISKILCVLHVLRLMISQPNVAELIQMVHRV
jgi:hypothetical protein